MKNAALKRLLSAFLGIALALQLVLPMAAYANEHPVQVENHSRTLNQAKQVSGILIDDVNAPKAGVPLDAKARVSTAEGDSWEVGTLWVKDDLTFAAGIAEEGRSYLPVLAYFTPAEYALSEDVFTVTLSDSLAKLFGTGEIVSVYSNRNGVTYILPASLISLFAHAEENSPTPQNSERSERAVSMPSGIRPEALSNGQPSAKPLVDIYCAKTARDNFSDADLEWIIDLIINYLEPQAVELLLDSFPAFREAANNGQIGTRLGLYVFYDKGDGDIPDHDTNSGALAYVSSVPKEIDGAFKYCYLLAVNLEGLTKVNKDFDPIFEPLVDPSTGKYILIRDGTELKTLENTIVHELFHAIMDDYNRTGMSGALTLQESYRLAKGVSPDDKGWTLHRALVFPTWFVEGSASAVENVYQFRYNAFQDLRRLQGNNDQYGTGNLSDRFTNKLLLKNYLYAMDNNGSRVYYDLEMSGVTTDENGKTINTANASYVTGYLATLYLCDLAVRSMNSGQSAMSTVNGVTTVSSTKLRDGLNEILRRSHEGETLDSIVCSLSPQKNGKKIYENTDELTKKFIKGTRDTSGTPIADDMDCADMDSLNFATTFLNYMLDLDTNMGSGRPNGSILKDFDESWTSPLDANKQTDSPYLKIVESNEGVESSVHSDTTCIGGGKSNPSAVNAEQGDSQEAKEQPSNTGESVEPEPAPAPEPVPEPALEPVLAEPVAEPTPEPKPAPAPAPES